MSSGSGDIAYVYGLLLAGKKLNVPFPDEAAAEAFRVSMFRHKRLQETQMLAIGMMEEHEKQSFVFRYDSETGLAKMHFEDKTAKRQYNFTIIEDDEESCDGPA